MQYQELQSAFASTIRSAELTSTEFDFAEAIDSAAMFFAINIPEDSVPEIMKIYNIDPVSPTSAVVTLPADYLKVESVQIAKLRDTLDNPIYIPAAIVNQRKFMSYNQYSDEAMVSFFNGVMNFNPEVAAAVANKAGSINMAYRSKPELYRTDKYSYAIGKLVNVLDQPAGQSKSFTTETANLTWAEIGLDTASLVGGKIVLINGSYAYTAEIDYAWDDDSGDFSGLHVRDDSGVPGISSGFAYGVFVIEAPRHMTSGDNIYKNGQSSPNINSAFHHVMLDYAIARFLFTRKPEVAQAFTNNVYQVLQAFGINMKIEFGGELK